MTFKIISATGKILDTQNTKYWILNTRYNAVFYILEEMAAGDKIIIFFNGRRYDYLVHETKITEATDVGYFTLKTPEQILVLQTCYPPGTTWERLLVIAKPVSGS